MTKPVFTISKTKVVTMPYGERQLLEIIRRLGVIRVDQLSKIAGYTAADKDRYSYFVHDLLYRDNGIRVTDDGYIVSAGIKKFKSGFAECLWDVIKNKETLDLDLVERAEAPCDLFYQQSDGTVVIDTFIDSSNIKALPYIQERYYARQLCENDEDDCSVLNIFVVTDPDIAVKIAKEYKMTMPYKICLLDYDAINNGIPGIRYLSKKQ